MQRRILLLALALAAVCAGAAADVAVDLRQDGPWLVAELPSGACRARLSLRSDAPAASFRDDCGDDPARSAARLGVLLDALSAREPRARAIESLDCGRLALLPGEAALRLARAAHGDAGWAQALAARAAGQEGPANRWVAATLVAQGVLAEYAQVLREHDLALASAGVEKVLVGVAGQQPELAPLPAAGVPPDLELPWDAIVWLRLAPVPDRPIH